MSRENSSSGVLLGAIVGDAIGAITALLLAPKTTNQNMMDSQSSAKEDAKDELATTGRQFDEG